MKLLILQNKILHYRKPLYNALCKYYDITVLHSGNKAVTEYDKFKEIIVNSFNIGPLIIQNKVTEIMNSGEYGIVVAMFDVRWLNNIRAMYIANKKGIIFCWWGVYFTKNKYVNWIRKMIAKKDNSILFYSINAMHEFEKVGIKKEKLFVANNTFHIENRIKSYENKNKNSILFVGSLDTRKQLNLLITAYNNVIDMIPKNIKLTFVGSGEDLDKAIKLTQDFELQDRILFEGKVTKTDELAKYYYDAIVSVSFGQAGLSVLQSFGYGVPFITKKNAVSGGEIYNVIDGVNGFLCEDTIDSLQLKLMYICNNVDEALKMGKNAFEYYSDFCTINNMVQGFRDAIEYKSRN